MHGAVKFRHVCGLAAQIVEYLESYVDHFGLRPHLVFRTEVVSVTPLAGGRHLVTTKARRPPRRCLRSCVAADSACSMRTLSHACMHVQVT